MDAQSRAIATHAFDHPQITAIVQSFSDAGHGQPSQLAEGLHAPPTPISELIVNDDGGTGRSAVLWKAALHRPSDIYVSMPNVHEVRAYNRLAAMARGRLLILLQGDNCLPNSTDWIARAVRLFDALPSLGLIGGSMGFDGMHQTGDNWREGWGGDPLHRIPSWVRGTGSAGVDAAIPFMHVGAVNIGPLIVQREAFVRIGGFNESFAERGQMGIHLDTDLSLRMWSSGYQVGLYYGGVGNGVNGRKTKRSAELRVSYTLLQPSSAPPIRATRRPCTAQMTHGAAQKPTHTLSPSLLAAGRESATGGTERRPSSATLRRAGANRRRR